jgi:hypothetical protein
MKLGTIIGIATLAMAMTLGGAVTPADAGDKKSKQKIHVRINDGLNQDQRIRLEKAAKKLKAPYRDAVLGEIERRRDIHSRNKVAKQLGEKIGGLTNIEDQIGLLGVFGTAYGKRRKGGH